MKIEALILLVNAYFAACDPPDTFNAVHVSPSTALRQQADRMDKCEEATQKLKQAVQPKPNRCMPVLFSDGTDGCN